MLDADLLQIDTEGYDATILRMIDFSRCRPRLIKFEHKSLSAGERAGCDRSRLRAHGYRIAIEGHGHDRVAAARTALRTYQRTFIRSKVPPPVRSTTW